MKTWIETFTNSKSIKVGDRSIELISWVLMAKFAGVWKLWCLPLSVVYETGDTREKRLVLDLSRVIQIVLYGLAFLAPCFVPRIIKAKRRSYHE